ncbi:CPBP family intramembrane glutamic endopeptidase [Natrinema salinisoli]|uniref:CPBP family intramembrane glutamic endopeptidase n=1 Tax=Natrinema salinisoli TaxID=2878535 RepID=UPI001CF00E1E|nr:CPBP family intramembrane glutamic endopeptidase [Natrinema salinisoli]
MQLLRERGSTRIRASLRGVLPAVVTLVLFLGGTALLGLIVQAVTEAHSSTEVLLASIGQFVLYAVLIGVAVWSAATLEHREYTNFGLTVDGDWMREFAAGIVITLLGIMVSVWWADVRGIRAVTLTAASITGPERPLLLGAVFGLFICYFLLGNIYEEVVYRRIVLGNFVEGLTARGVSPQVAVILATVVSLLLFGVYHIPLRGNIVVALDAALTGIPFALAYLLTDRLALPVGIHFGRILIEFLHGRVTRGEFNVSAIVEITQDTLLANLEFKLLRIGLTCLGILTWVYLHHGEIQIAKTVYRRNSDHA